MADDKQQADSVTESAITSEATTQQEAATPAPVASTPATPTTETAAKEKAENDVSHAQESAEETARRLLEAHKATLEQEGPAKSEIIRQVLEALHANDSNVLNSDIYPEIKYQIAKKLGVSKTLVDNNKKTVLKAIVDSSSGDVSFPKEPFGSTPKQPQEPAGPAATGAPIGGMAAGAAAAASFVDEAQSAASEPVAKWTPEQVKFLFRFGFRMANKMAKDWDLLTEEEEKDIGKLLPPIFDKIFPTTESNQNYVMIGVVILSLFGPRLQKTVGPWMAARKAKKGTSPNSGSAASQ